MQGRKYTECELLGDVYKNGPLNKYEMHLSPPPRQGRPIIGGQEYKTALRRKKKRDFGRGSVRRGAKGEAPRVGLHGSGLRTTIRKEGESRGGKKQKKTERITSQVRTN